MDCNTSSTEILGKGEYGIVRSEYDVNNNLVAVKTTINSDDNGIEPSFLCEVNILRKLSGEKCIVNMLDIQVRRTKSNTISKITLEWMNSNLYDVSRSIPYEMRKSMYKLVLDNIKSALSSLHMMNIIHCDVKPQNILVSKNSNEITAIKLCDFGNSCIMAPEASTIKYSEPLYPHIFRPPEVEMKHDYGTKADIWSLCITMVDFMVGCTMESPPCEIRAIPSLNSKHRGRLSFKHLPEKMDIRKYVSEVTILSDEDIRTMEQSLEGMYYIDPNKRFGFKSEAIVKKDVLCEDNLTNDLSYLAKALGYSERSIKLSIQLYNRLLVLDSSMKGSDTLITCLILVIKMIEPRYHVISEIVGKWKHKTSSQRVMKLEVHIMNKVGGLIID